MRNHLQTPSGENRHVQRQQIIRSDDLRAENRHRLLSTLRADGPSSRTHLGDSSGLSQAALSNLLGDMIEQGIVMSSNNNSTGEVKRGRPQSTISLNPLAGLGIALALTNDRCVVCATDYSGQLNYTHELRLDTKTADQASLLQTFTDQIERALHQHKELPLRAISVGFQGVTDPVQGEFLWSPIISLQKLPVAEVLREYFDVPVAVNNDCLLIAKALHKAQGEVLTQNFSTVLLSCGVGMGLYLSGEPFTGIKSSGLELGHIEYIANGARCRCGKLGCIEAYASDYGLLRAAAGGAEQDQVLGFVTDKEIASLCRKARQGDAKIVEAFATAGRAIGHGLSSVFSLFDPMPVALVGRRTEMFEFMRDDIIDSLASSGRERLDFSNLINMYDNDDSLLQQGLHLDAMANIDKQFAHLNPQLVE